LYQWSWKDETEKIYPGHGAKATPGIKKDADRLGQWPRAGDTVFRLFLVRPHDYLEPLQLLFGVSFFVPLQLLFTGAVFVGSDFSALPVGADLGASPAFGLSAAMRLVPVRSPAMPSPAKYFLRSFWSIGHSPPFLVQVCILFSIDKFDRKGKLLSAILTGYLFTVKEMVDAGIAGGI
jgi:hypothetical protein